MVLFQLGGLLGIWAVWHSVQRWVEDGSAENQGGHQNAQRQFPRRGQSSVSAGGVHYGTVQSHQRHQDAWTGHWEAAGKDAFLLIIEYTSKQLCALILFLHHANTSNEEEEMGEGPVTNPNLHLFDEEPLSCTIPWPTTDYSCTQCCWKRYYPWLPSNCVYEYLVIVYSKQNYFESDLIIHDPPPPPSM